MLVVTLVNFNEAVQALVIFPFLPFAVQDWGASEEQTGAWVGTLIGAFFLGQTIFVALWGRASDTYGRRPTLLWGTLGTAISMALFGFSRSLPLALLARFMCGALNANVAIAKSVVAEISDTSTIARAFSYLSFSWGAGCIFAPLLGSVLAKPAEAYPSVFGSSALLRAYPYLMPSLVSVVIALSTFTLGWFHLPETAVWARAHGKLPPHGHGGAGAVAGTDDGGAEVSEATDAAGSGERSPVEGATDTEMRRRNSSSDGMQGLRRKGAQKQAEPPLTPVHHRAVAPTARDTSDDAVTDVNNSVVIASAQPSSDVEVRVNRSDQLSGVVSGGESNRPDAFKLRGDEEEDSGEGVGLLSGAATLAPLRLPPSALSRSGTASKALRNPATSAAERSGVANVADARPPPPPPSTIRGLLSDSAIVTAVLSYGALCTTQVLFDELLPVFCETPVAVGGLGFLLSEIGRVQIAQGVATIAAQLIFVPWLINRVGPRRAYRGAMIPVAAVGIFPALGRLATRPALLWPVLAAAMALKALLFSIAFSSIMIVINNSSRGVSLGAVNGLGQTVASAVRCIGPFLGGPLYSASISFEALGSYRLHVVYAVQALFAVAGCAASFLLPAWLDQSPDFAALDKAPGRVGDQSTAQSTIVAKSRAARDFEMVPPRRLSLHG